MATTCWLRNMGLSLIDACTLSQLASHLMWGLILILRMIRIRLLVWFEVCVWDWGIGKRFWAEKHGAQLYT